VLVVVTSSVRRGGGTEVLGHLGEFVGDRVEDPIELRMHRGGVGLVIDRVQQRPSPRPGPAMVEPATGSGVIPKDSTNFSTVTGRSDANGRHPAPYTVTPTWAPHDMERG
jgi:hypothetical protein